MKTEQATIIEGTYRHYRTNATGELVLVGNVPYLFVGAAVPSFDEVLREHLGFCAEDELENLADELTTEDADFLDYINAARDNAE